MSILKIKDQNGQWTDVLSIKGEKGDNGQDYVLTENDKQEIAQDVAELVDIPVDDVQIDGTSIVQNGVAEIPVGGQNKFGVFYAYQTDGVASLSDGRLVINPSTDDQIKGGQSTRRPVIPAQLDKATFYGLAKASGDTTQSQSSNAVGTYTDEAKASIQSMLGIPSEDEVITDVQINGASIVTDGMAEIPVASTSTLGAVTCAQDYGITVLSNGRLQTTSPSDAQLKSGSSNYRVITPTNQHKSVFYGLAKASGDTTQSESDNAVGTYTDEAKSAIQSMLGIPSEDEVVTDVQVNGTSIVTDGVAEIPVASNSNYGVVKINAGYGITFNSSNALTISRAGDTSTKEGTEGYKPITPVCQHRAVFYGLAKAAGADEKNSILPVGQYTESAQTAIKQMLGVKDDYDSLVVEVSGTDPVITGKASYRYNCGELYTLSITPPEFGTMDIIFTSGATPTVLTLPNTVKMPTWWAGIETNTTYEMCITDGVYCGVMSWAT